MDIGKGEAVKAWLEYYFKRVLVLRMFHSRIR